jgi:hypothetical protein
MLHRLESNRLSMADDMIQSFDKDDGLKKALKFLDGAIDSIERNHDHSEEVALLKIAKFGIREKILLLAYQ